jgi:predicted transcriptional regulator of viral defense system
MVDRTPAAPVSTHGISGSGRAELAAVAGRRRFVSPEDAAAELGVDAHVAARKLAHWAEKGWLRRVRRGLYIPVPVEAERPESWSQDAMVVAVAVWSPCYFSGWTAAAQWSLTEQVFRTTIVKTVRRVRRSDVRLLDADYLLVHAVQESMGWGLKPVWQEEVRLLIADPARTVVDILDAPRIGGGIRHAAEILGSYLDEHDPQLLVEYADRLDNRAVFKRLGFLVEALGREEPALTAACLARLSAGIALLDPDGPKSGPRVPRWSIRANVRVAAESPS